MFTTMLAHAKLLALAGLIGGGAAYATHNATSRPGPQDQQNQQWQDQDQGDHGDRGPQNFRDQQPQPFEVQDFNHQLNRRIDQQVDRHLNNLLNCQPRPDFHRGYYSHRR